MSCSVVNFRGEFDLADKAAIDLALRAFHDETIIVDLSNATYIDSTIIGTFMMLERRASEQNLDVRYVLGDSPVSRIIEVTNLHTVLNVFPSVSEATTGNTIDRTHEFVSRTCDFPQS